MTEKEPFDLKGFVQSMLDVLYTLNDVFCTWPIVGDPSTDFAVEQCQMRLGQLQHELRKLKEITPEEIEEKSNNE